MMKFRALLICLLALLGFSSCVTPSGSGSGGEPKSPALVERDALIKLEPTGDFYIGRRYVTERTRFWGYLRRPRQTWDQSKLVIMNESIAHVPDRLRESATPEPGSGFGFDHNYEYRIYGSYSGKTIYDPNANYFLPEFVIERYELIDADPGFLFKPGVRYDSRALPPRQ
jgi:hypothetical protein